MTKQDTKIKFLAALDAKANLFNDLSEFFLAEKIATKEEIYQILRQPLEFRAAEFYILMKRCEEKMLMVDWEWRLLPTEFMKLIIVTPNGVKDFTWAT